MALLPWSTMRYPPSGRIVTPIGLPSWAALAGPPSPLYPGMPVPAIVDTVFDCAWAPGACASSAHAIPAPTRHLARRAGRLIVRT
jgi:hypothetical protein